METPDFLASVKCEVLAKEDEELPIVDYDPPPDASPGFVVNAELHDVQFAPVSIKVEQGALDKEVTLWNVSIPIENVHNPNEGVLLGKDTLSINEHENDTLFINDHEKDTLFINGHEDDPEPDKKNDPDYQPASENESDGAPSYPDHDYTPMTGIDPSSLTHIEILDCQQNKEKGYRCPHCLYTTNRLQHFETHIVCHSDDKPFKCNQCEFSTARKAGLTNHVTYMHSDGKLFNCEHCDYSTRYSYSLKAHMKRHSDEQNISCPRCDFKTKHWASLKSHLVVHTDVKSLKCQYCDFQTKHVASLRYHLKVHASDRSYKCDQCAFTATSSSNLKQHKQTHSEERPYPCEICHLKFKSSTLLKNHVKITHLKVRNYKCDICDKRFSNSGNLQRHQIVHNGPSKLFECPDCHVVFTLESNLKRHLKKHKNPVSYRCRLCHHTFTELINLRRHINTVHLRAIQIPCPYCNKTLTTGTTLRRHILTFHEEMWSEKEHGKRVYLKQFTTGAVTPKQVLEVIGEPVGEVPQSGRRRMMPTDDSKRTIIEPEYDTELIETLSRLDTSPEVLQKYKKKKATAGATIKTSLGAEVQKRRGRPPKAGRPKIALIGKTEKQKLVIRKPSAYMKKQTLLKYKTRDQLEGIRKVGRPPKDQSKLTNSGNKSAVRTLVQKKRSPSQLYTPNKGATSSTGTGKKRGRPKKLVNMTVENSLDKMDASTDDLCGQSVLKPYSCSTPESPMKKRRGRPPKNRPPENSLNEMDTSTDDQGGQSELQSSSCSTPESPMKKRRGRPPKNRPPEMIVIPETDIVYESDIPVGSTCSEISAAGNFRKNGRRNSERDIYGDMVPLTLNTEGVEHISVFEGEESSTVISGPDMDHLYAAPLEISDEPEIGETSADIDLSDPPQLGLVMDIKIELPPKSFNKTEEAHAKEPNNLLANMEAPVEIQSTVSPVETEIALMGPTQSKNPIEPENRNDSLAILSNTKTEILASMVMEHPLDSSSLENLKNKNDVMVSEGLHDIVSSSKDFESSIQAAPSESSDGVGEADMASVTISHATSDTHCLEPKEDSQTNIETVTNADALLVKPAISSNECERSSKAIETSCDAGLATGIEADTCKKIAPEEQSNVLTYFGLQRKQMEDDQGTSAGVDVDAISGDEMADSSRKETDQIRGPDISIGSMRTQVSPKHYEGLSSLLRQAKVKNKIRGRPWIMGTARDQQRYLQEKAWMTMPMAKKRGRPPKMSTNSRIGRPKGSKNRVKQEPTDIVHGMRKSHRKHKTSQRMLESYESNSKLCKKDSSTDGDVQGKRKFSAKFQEMIDSLINSDDEYSGSDGDEYYDGDGASESDLAETAVRKSKRARTLSSKKREMIETGQWEGEVPILHAMEMSNLGNEEPPRKKAQLSKISPSPKLSKRSCLLLSARNAKAQKSDKKALIDSSKYAHLIKPSSVEMTRIDEHQGKETKNKSVGLKKMNLKKSIMLKRHALSKGPKKGCKTKGKVKDLGRTSMKGRQDKDVKTRKERFDKGIIRGHQNSSTPRKVRWDKGVQKGPQGSATPRKIRADKGVQKGPQSSVTPRKVRSDKGHKKIDSAKQMSKEPSSAAGASDQNCCMVAMSDFSELFKTAKVVYVLPAESHLGKLAAASNSVMCLVPENDNVIIPPGAIAVRAISSSTPEEMPPAKSHSTIEPNLVQVNEKDYEDDSVISKRKVRRDKGKQREPRTPKQNDHTYDTSEPDGLSIPSESEGQEMEIDPDFSPPKQLYKSPHKVRSDKGKQRKCVGIPGEVDSVSTLCSTESSCEMDSDQKASLCKKPRKERSDKGIPRKQKDNLVNSDIHMEPDSSTEYTGIYSDPNQCLSMSAKKHRKVRFDKGLVKGPRKPNKQANDTDVGTIVLTKESGRPKLIQTSKLNNYESSFSESGSLEQMPKTADLNKDGLVKKRGRPKKNKTSDDQESLNPSANVSAKRCQEQSFVVLDTKRQRKPKVIEDYVSLDDEDLEEISYSDKPKVNMPKKRGRPPKSSSPDEGVAKTPKWLKVTLQQAGSETVVFSPSSVKKSTTQTKKHTARKSFPKQRGKLPTVTSQTDSLYSDVFPEGGIPVPIMDKNPILSQINGTQTVTSGYSEADRAVMSLTESDPSVQEEFVYVDLVMDPSIVGTQQFSILATATEGLQGTVVSGIEGQPPQPVSVEIVEASHLQPLLDHGTLTASQGHSYYIAN